MSLKLCPVTLGLLPSWTGVQSHLYAVQPHHRIKNLWRKTMQTCKWPKWKPGTWSYRRISSQQDYPNWTYKKEILLIDDLLDYTRKRWNELKSIEKIFRCCCPFIWLERIGRRLYQTLFVKIIFRNCRENGGHGEKLKYSNLNLPNVKCSG